MIMNRRLLSTLYVLALGALSWLSYSFVDPNLTLLNQPWFISWQAQRWQLASDPVRLGLWFLVLTTAVFFGYLGVLAWIKRGVRLRALPLWLVSAGIILLLGHNAYSYDIFNYLFNAKMVVLYHVNPHVQVALNFPTDEWLRFMHNVHTPAPYGYGWTLLSLVPFSLGLGKFLSAYLAMKLFMALGLAVYLFFVWKLLLLEKAKDASFRWAQLAFHPLLLVETLMNGHNDVWMMWPALAALYFLRRPRQSIQSIQSIIFGALGLAFSIFTKFATVLLLPVAVIELPFLKKVRPFSWWREHWSEFSALVLLAPLITSRSQQFHPWYLIWSLSFLPFIKWRWLRSGLMGLSISSLYRYWPWILERFGYTPQVELNMRFITWSGWLVGLLFWLIGDFLGRHRRVFTK